MKNLELMGVQEMDAVEMKNENGGFLPLTTEWWALKICEFYLGFQEGWAENKR